MNILGKLIKFKTSNNNKQNLEKIISKESQASIGSIDISGNQLPQENNNNKNKNFFSHVQNENQPNKSNNLEKEEDIQQNAENEENEEN